MSVDITEYEALEEHFGHPIEIVKHGEEMGIRCNQCDMLIFLYAKPDFNEIYGWEEEE